MTFPGRFLDFLGRTTKSVALEHGARRVTCGELLDTVRHIASGLRRRGLTRGSVVALELGLTPEAFATHLAAYASGCTVMAVRPAWTAAQRAAVLAEVDALITEPLVLMSGQPPEDGDSLAAQGRPNDTARVNFTSGSSGRPKGCAWTYASLEPAFDPDAWPPDLARLMSCFERYLVFNDWSVPIMFTFAVRTISQGGTVVIGPSAPQPPQGLRPHEPPKSTLSYGIKNLGVTGVVIPVPALHRMLDALRADPVEPGSLRALVVTGSPAAPYRLAEAVERLGAVVWQGYGQSESGMISLLTPEDLDASSDAIASVGRVLPHVTVSVRDSSGRDLPAGETGTIFVRSAQLMSGYWGADAPLTGEVLRGGWLDTRDLGYLDHKGYLHLSGRSRDVIMVNAHVCYAAAIEQVLVEDDAVAEAYVVGVPNDRSGEAIHAFVVPTGDAGGPDPDVLGARVRADLGEDHVPASFTVIDEVPLGVTGKPDKLTLRERVR